MPPGTAGSTSAVNIVINATDRASGVISGIQSSFSNLSKLVNEPLQNALSNLSRATNSVSQDVVDKIGSIGKAFENLSSTVASGVDLPLDGITRSLVKIPELFELSFTRGSDAARIALAGIGDVDTGNLARSLDEVPQLLGSAFDRGVQSAKSTLQDIGGIDLNGLTQSLTEVPQLFSSTFDRASKASGSALQNIGGIDSDKLSLSLAQVPGLFASTFTRSSQIANNALQGIGGAEADEITRSFDKIPQALGSSFTRGSQVAQNALQGIGKINTGELEQSLGKVPALFNSTFTRSNQLAQAALQNIDGVDTSRLTQSLSNVPQLFNSTFVRSSEVVTSALQNIGEVDTAGKLNQSLAEVPQLFNSAFTRSTQLSQNALKDIGEVDTTALMRSLNIVPDLFTSAFSKSTQSATNALTSIGRLDVNELNRSLNTVPQLFDSAFSRSSQVARNSLKESIGELDTSKLNQSLGEIPTLFDSTFTRSTQMARDALQNVGDLDTSKLTQKLSEVPSLFTSAFSRSTQSATAALQTIGSFDISGLNQSLNKIPQLFDSAFTKGTESAQGALHSVGGVDTSELARSLDRVPQLFTSAFTRGKQAVTSELQNVGELNTEELSQSLNEVPRLFESAFDRGNQLAQNALKNIGDVDVDDSTLNQSLAEIPALFNSTFNRSSQVASDALQKIDYTGDSKLAKSLDTVPQLLGSSFARGSLAATAALQNIGTLDNSELKQSLNDVPQLFNSAFTRGSLAASNALQSISEVDTSGLAQSLAEIPQIFTSTFDRGTQSATAALQGISGFDVSKLNQSLSGVPQLFDSTFTKSAKVAQDSLQSIGGINSNTLNQSLASIPELFSSTFARANLVSQSALQNLDGINTGKLTRSLSEVPQLFQSAFDRGSKVSTAALQNIGGIDTDKLNLSLAKVPDLFASTFTRGSQTAQNALENIGGIDTDQLNQSLEKIPQYFNSAFIRGSQAASSALQNLDDVDITTKLSQSLSDVPQLFNLAFSRGSLAASNAVQSIGKVNTSGLAQSLAEVPQLFNSTFTSSAKVAQDSLQSIGGINSNTLSQSLAEIPVLFNSAFTDANKMAQGALQNLDAVNTEELTRSLNEIPNVFASTFDRSSQNATAALQEIGDINTDRLNRSLAEVPQLFNSAFGVGSKAAREAVGSIGEVDTGKLNKSLDKIPGLFTSAFTRGSLAASSALKDIDGIDTDKLSQSVSEVPGLLGSAFNRGSLAATNALQDVGELNTDELARSLTEIPSLFNSSFVRGSQLAQEALQSIGGIDTKELGQSLISVPQLFTSTFDRGARSAQNILKDIGDVDTSNLSDSLGQVSALVSSTFTRSRQVATNALKNIGVVDTSELNQSLRQVPISFASAFGRGSAVAKNSLQNIGDLDTGNLTQSLDEIPKLFEKSFNLGSVAAQNAIKEIGTNTDIIESFGTALGFIGIKARDSGVELLKLGSQVTQLGSLTTAAIGGSVLGSFNTLSEVIANVKKAINAPVVKPFIDLFRQQAEDATKEVAPLTDILKETASVSGDFAKGFVGATSVLDTLEGRVRGAADKAGSAFQDSIADKFKAINIDFGGAKLPGLEKIASQVDRQLAGAISGNLLDKLVGTGPVQNLARNLITSPAVTQLLPDVASNLIGGSLVGSVDAALGMLQAEGARGKVRQAFDFADSFAIPSLEIPGVKINSQTILQDIEGTLSSAVLSTGIKRAVGDGPIANALNAGLRGLAQAPVLQGILPQFIRDLSTGSFTEATKGLFVSTFTSGFKSSFQALNQIATDGAENVGGKVATQLIEGLDDETKKKLANTRAILGSALDGIGERMAKGLGLGSKVPGLAQLFPELSALNKADDILFGAFSKGIGALVQSKLPKLFIPLVEAATGAVGDTGSQVVANAIASFFPNYLQGIVANTVQEIGLSRGIFDTIFDNIQPDALRGNIGVIGKFIDQLLVNTKTGILGITGFAQNVVQTIINGLNGIDGVLARTRSGIGTLANFLTGFLGNLGSGITNAIGSIDGGLNAVKGALPAIFAALAPVGTVFDALKTGLQSAVGFVQSGFTQLGTMVNSTLGQIQSGIGAIAATVDRFVAGIQSSIVPAISGIGSFLESQINAARTAVPGLVEGLAQGFDRLGAFVSGNNPIGSLVNDVRGLAGPIDAILTGIGASLKGSFAGLSGTVNGSFNAIRQGLSGAFSTGIQAINNLQAAVNTVLGEMSASVDRFVGNIQSGIVPVISGFGAALEAQIDSIRSAVPGLVEGLAQGLERFGSLVPGGDLLGGFAQSIRGLAAPIDAILSGFGASVTRTFAQLSSSTITSFNIIRQGLRSAFEGGIQAVNTLQSAANQAFGAISTNVDRFASTIQSGIVPAVSGIGDLLEAQFDGVRNSVPGLVEGLAQGLGRLSTAIPGGNLLGNLASSIRGIAAPIDTVLTDVGSSFTRTFSEVSNQVDTATNTIRQSVGGIFESGIEAVDDFKGATDGAFGAIDTALDRVKTGIGGFGVSIGQVEGILASVQGGFTALGGSATDFIDGLIGGISGAETTLDGFIGNIQSAIAPAISGATGALNQVFAGLGSGGAGATSFIDDIRNAIPGAVTALQDYVTAAEGFANGVFEKVRGIANGLLGEIIDLAGKAIGAINQNFVPGIESAFKAVDGYFGGIFSDAMGELARNAAAGFGRGFVGGFINQFGPAIDAVDGFVLDVHAKLSGLATGISEPIAAMANVPGAIAGFTEPLEVFNILQESVGSVTNGIFDLSQKMAFFTQGFDAIKQLAAGGPFQALIGQTVELRSQLLSTQSSIVGTMQVMQNGVAIKDPTEAITSLEEPIRNVIEQMRTESLELVGVTSNELVPLFQTLAGQMGNIGANLGDVKNLTLDFAASLGTLNIPLGMAQQEISSIATGQIDMNSALAKSLNITNEQVANWKSQGKFVEELRKRLEAFRAGNAIAAKSLAGVTSNIQEIFDEITRKAGEKLLEPLLDQLAGVYSYLLQNKEALIESLSGITDYILQAGLAVADVLKTLFGSLGGLGESIPQYLFKSLANGVVEFSNAIKFTIELLQPAINVIVELAKSALALSGPFLKAFLTLKSLEVGVNAVGKGFGILSQVLPGTGELMFLLDQRSSGVINQFVTMTKVVGSGGSAFLLLGQNIANIPGGLDMIAKAMGPFGGLFAGFVPQIATVGIQVVGLIKMFPALGLVLGNLLTISPALVQSFKLFATGPQVLGGALAPLGGLFDQVSDKLKTYAYSTDRAGLLSQQLKTVLFDVGKSVAQQVFSFGLLAGGAFLAFKAFDEFVLKNEDLKQALGYVAQGLGVMKDLFLTALTNPVTGAIIAVVALRGAIMLGLLPAVQGLIATTIAQWFTGLSTALGGAAIAAGNTGNVIGGLAGVLNTLKFTGMAAGASEAAAGFAALSQAVTSGTLTFTQANAVMALQSIAFKVAAGATALFQQVLAAVGLGNTALAISSGAASTGLAVQGTAAAAASGGFGVLGASIWSCVVGLTALLAPVIAVGAAIAAMGSIVYTGVGPLKGIADYAEETANTYQAQTDAIADASFALGAKLKAASNRQKEADADGVALTEEQYKANAKLQAQGKLQVQSIDEQLAALKDAKKERFADKDALEAQEKQLKSTRDSLNKLSTEIKIAPKPLQELGTTYDQLSLKAKGAEDAITKSSGDPEMFKKKGQELIELTQKQLELGDITTDEANRRYSLLANNINADQEVQIKAQQAITKANEEEGKKRVENKDAEIASIEAKTASGQLKEVEGAIATTKARDEQLKLQLESAQTAYDARIRLLDEEEKKSLDKLKKQADAAKVKLDAAPPDTKAYKSALKEYETAQGALTEAESSFGNQRAEEDRKFNNQRTKLEADAQKNVAEGAKREFDARQSQLEKAQDKALDTVKTSENERLITEQKLYNQGRISKSEYDEAKAKSTVKTAEQELNAEKTRQAELEKLLTSAATPKIREEIEGKLRDSRIKSQELVQKSLTSERDAYEAHITTVKSALERQNNTAQAKDEQNVREGIIIKEEAEREKADATVKRLEQELALETKDKDKRAQLELQLQQALSAQDDARIKERLQRIDNSNTEQSTREEQQVRSGQIIKEDAENRKAQSAIKRIQAELSAEQDLNKRVQLKLQLEEAITKAREAEVQRRVQILENATNVEAAADERAAREGLQVREESEANKADAAVKRIQIELDGEKDVSKQAALRVQLEEAITKAREAEVQRRVQILENAANVEAAADERAVRGGLQIREESETNKADAAIKRIQAELDGEKDVSKQASLRLQLEEAITKQRDTEVQKRLKLMEIANNQEQALDEEAYRAGKLRKEQLDVDRAQSTVDRLEEELSLEKDNIEKRTALELQLQQARTSLQEAQLTQHKAQLEEENQAYQNQLEQQLAPLKAQQSVFDLLNKALENRNKLLSASRELLQAGTNYLTGELEAISSVETSEYRRKQLAQGMAAIKLEAAKKEAEMTKASLAAEEQMQRFALMREQIENRVAIAKQVGETAKLQGQIAVAEADPRTSKAQKDALYIQLEAAKQQQAQLQGVGVLLAQQAPLQEQAFAMKRRSSELQADASVTQATAALINTLAPGAKERAARAFQEQESQKVFGVDYRELRYGSRALARQAVDEAVPSARIGQGAGISGFAPYLEEVGASGRAMAQASSDLAQMMGPAAGGGQFFGAGAAPLKLPDVVGKVPGLDEINRSSQAALTQSLQAYQQTGLKLPPAADLGQIQLPKTDIASEGLLQSSSTFEKAVAQFAKAVESGQNTKSTPRSGNVTVNVQQQKASDLATVLNYAKQLGGG